jgi:hypothetical protein
MSAAVNQLVEIDLAAERAALRRRLHIPEPEDIYRNPPSGDPEKAMALLNSWLEEDDSDEPQAETWEYLKRVLDEDRLSPDRKLFP